MSDGKDVTPRGGLGTARLPRLVVVLIALATPGPAAAQLPPLLSDAQVAALAAELSGENARRAVDAISQYHRMRGSPGFRAAAEWVADRARAYGLQDVRLLEFPADGRIFYGTQRSRPPWWASSAELWELRRDGDDWVPVVRYASWEASPIALAEDSESGEATAELVDVGEGTSEADYAGKDVAGRIVLAAAQPGAVAPLAVAGHGAVGIVSWAQNQRQAWWGEDGTLVRWGHLGAFTPAAARTWAFMISPDAARALRTRLQRGERIMLHAEVDAGQRPGAYTIVTATIPGADPRRRDEEIVFNCHLDHQRPAANDNASGCATILEVARTLARLIADGRLPRPSRTLRFVWPPEIEGSLAMLDAQPEWAVRVRAVVHLDMVGGGPQTKAVMHVTRGPASLPSFVYDVAAAFGRLANEESYAFATSGAAAIPLVAPSGGREALLARLAEFSMGSDHEVYAEGSWGIPPIYLNDSPDRYVHTDRDVPENIDPTKLLRAAFIAAGSGYFLASMDAEDVPAVGVAVRAGRLRREALRVERRAELSGDDLAAFDAFWVDYERRVDDSIGQYLAPRPGPDAATRTPPADAAGAGAMREATPVAAEVILHRNPEPKGPMSVFDYDYLADHYGDGPTAALALPGYRGLWGDGERYTYEVLNLVDGRRTVGEIRDDVTAIYGPVPLAAVAEYLGALESIGVVGR